jgi:phosphate-selective porin OprO/OprP
MRNRPSKALGVALVALAFSSFPLPGPAHNAALLDLLEVLRSNGTIDQQSYEALRNTVLRDQEQNPAQTGHGNESAQEEVKAATAGLTVIETKDKLVIGSRDGAFEWQPIGRLMTDYNLIDSDSNKLGSGAEIRRARLGMEGVLSEHWIFKTEWDFAGSTVSAKDLFIGYAQDSWWVKFGQHHIPFGLATMSSSKHMLFVERPLLADQVLQPARQIGVAAFNHWGERATLHIGAFAGTDGEDPDACLPAFDECDEQLSVAARGTFIPIIVDKNHLVHLGAAVWHLDPQDSEVRVRQRPGHFHAVDTRFQDADFGVNGVENVLAFNLEAAAVWGPVSVQGEYTNWEVARTRSPGTAPTDPRPADATLDGWYVEAAYFLTGESMNFKAAEGLYGGIKPQGVVGRGGFGAWQLAIRFDTMDLNDEEAGLVGGKQDSLAVGLNWYVNNTMRFMADYVTVLDMERPGSRYDEDEPSGFLFRGQVYW